MTHLAAAGLGLWLLGAGIASAQASATREARPSSVDASATRPAGDTAAAATTLSRQPRRRPVRDAPDVVSRVEPALRLRLSGHIGFTSFTASDSFKAVLDTSSGVIYGGGGGVLIGRHLFVDVQGSRFSADGERVFVTDDLEVFPLGVPATVTVTPIDVSVGWRFTPGRPAPGGGPRRGVRPVPFAAGGVGLLRYRESAEFAEPGDDVNESHGSYHLLGGVELPFSRRLGASADALYRWVPDALGEGGVSAAYGDTDLGGFTVRVRGTFTF